MRLISAPAPAAPEPSSHNEGWCNLWGSGGGHFALFALGAPMRCILDLRAALWRWAIIKRLAQFHPILPCQAVPNLPLLTLCPCTDPKDHPRCMSRALKKYEVMELPDAVEALLPDLEAFDAALHAADRMGAALSSEMMEVVVEFEQAIAFQTILEGFLAEWTEAGARAPQYLAELDVLLPELAALAEGLEGIQAYVTVQEVFYEAIRKAEPNAVLERVHLFPNGTGVNRTLPDSQFIQDAFLSRLPDQLAELQRDVLQMAGQMGVVPEVVRPWFMDLAANLDSFSAVIDEIERVNCVEWDPDQYTEEGLCNAESNLRLRALLNPVVDAAATLQSVPTLPEVYRTAASDFADGILELYTLQKQVIPRLLPALQDVTLSPPPPSVGLNGQAKGVGDITLSASQCALCMCHHFLPFPALASHSCRTSPPFSTSPPPSCFLSVLKVHTFSYTRKYQPAYLFRLYACTPQQVLTGIPTLLLWHPPRHSAVQQASTEGGRVWSSVAIHQQCAGTQQLRLGRCSEKRRSSSVSARKHKYKNGWRRQKRKDYGNVK